MQILEIGLDSAAWVVHKRQLAQTMDLEFWTDQVSGVHSVAHRRLVDAEIPLKQARRGLG